VLTLSNAAAEMEFQQSQRQTVFIYNNRLVLVLFVIRLFFI